MNTSENTAASKGAVELPPIPQDCPKDYTYKTTLVQKGKLAPKGCIWVELLVKGFRTGSTRTVGRFAAPMPKGLTREQEEYFTARMRMRIKEETGR